MKTLVNFFFVFAILFLASCTAKKQQLIQSVSSVPLPALGIMDSIKKYVGEMPNGTELAVAMVDGESAGFMGYRKEADTVNFSINNQRSIFEIGSITKTFTATLLTTAIMEGEVKLDEPINRFFDFPLNNGVELTFQELANHHSGLARLPANMSMMDMGNPYATYGGDKMNDFLRNYLEPGEKKYAYSNLGAGLLAYTLEHVYDKSFEELVQEKIARPYRLSVTTTQPEANKDFPLIQGLDGSGQPVAHWTFGSMAGAGALYSCTNDLSRLMQAHFDDQQLALTKTREFTAKVNDRMSIGLGWHIIAKPDRNDYFWHNGGTSGFTSSMVFDPVAEIGVVILSNVSAFNPRSRDIDRLAFEIMDSLSEVVNE